MTIASLVRRTRSLLGGRRGELVAGLLLAMALGAVHLATVARVPLPRSMFHGYYEPNGTEAEYPSRVLLRTRELQQCPPGLACLERLISASDTYSPPVTLTAYTLWALLVGHDLVRLSLLGLGWLLLGAAALFAMARQAAGPRAAWLALLLYLACPVFLAPSRSIYHDVPAVSLMLVFFALMFRTVHRPNLVPALLAGVAMALACLSKWESLMPIAAFCAGLFVYALSLPRRRKTLAILTVALAAGHGLLCLYLALFDSASFQMRPDLAILFSLDQLLDRGGMTLAALFQGGDDAPLAQAAGAEPLGQRVAHNAIFYLGAIPSASAGLLVTVVTTVGLAASVGRKSWRLWLLVLPWTAASLVLLGVAAGSLWDDRFVHFFLPGLLLLAAVGLARLKPAPLVLGVVGVVAVLQVWDISLLPSPLPKEPSVARPTPSAARSRPEDVLSARPADPMGHATWVRPERQLMVDLDGIQRALALAADAGSRQVILSRRCSDACRVGQQWFYAATLLNRIPVLANMASCDSGPDQWCKPTVAHLHARLFKAGSVLVLPLRPEGQEATLAQIDWGYESCFALPSPASHGLKLRVLGRVKVYEEELLLVQLVVGQGSGSATDRQATTRPGPPA